MDIFEIISGLFFLNYNGGTIHYIYGTIWRTIFNRPNFTYKEYLNGSKGKNYYDKMGNKFNNRMIVFIF